MRVVSIVIISCVSLSGAQVLQNDQQAYAYCREEPRSFIAIVWPIAQGKDTLIKKILNSYGHIMYHKKFYFNKADAYTILQQAHQHIPAAQPHCGSIKEHVKWYFPKSAYQNPARIFVLYFENPARALACKHAIRNLFPGLQYRSIHINDYHSETIELAEFFFNA